LVNQQFLIATVSAVALLSELSQALGVGTDVSTPVLLRRISRLEAAAGRLSEGLGSLRSALVSRQELQAGTERTRCSGAGGARRVD
jgi:hypothetical protein